MKFSFATVKVKDMEESVEFYTDVLRLKEVSRFSPRPGVNIVFLRDGEDGKIELVEHEAADKTEITSGSQISIGFSVEDLNEVLSIIKEKNIKMLSEPVEHDGVKFVYILDPNGAEIELIQGFSI